MLHLYICKDIINNCEYGIARGQVVPQSRAIHSGVHICVLVQLASWGDAMHHALNKLSSPCSELLAGERVIRSDAHEFRARLTGDNATILS